MSRPLVATVSHSLGWRRAKRRVENGIGSIRSQHSAFAMSIDDHWTDDRLDFRLVAAGQVVTAKVEVFDDVVRVEMNLPGMHGVLAEKIAGRVRDHGTKMLEKK